MKSVCIACVTRDVLHPVKKCNKKRINKVSILWHIQSQQLQKRFYVKLFIQSRWRHGVESIYVISLSL